MEVICIHLFLLQACLANSSHPTGKKSKQKNKKQKKSGKTEKAQFLLKNMYGAVTL